MAASLKGGCVSSSPQLPPSIFTASHLPHFCVFVPWLAFGFAAPVLGPCKVKNHFLPSCGYGLDLHENLISILNIFPSSTPSHRTYIPFRPGRHFQVASSPPTTYCPPAAWTLLAFFFLATSSEPPLCPNHQGLLYSVASSCSLLTGLLTGPFPSAGFSASPGQERPPSCTPPQPLRVCHPSLC